jgi:hypothetical protein
MASVRSHVALAGCLMLASGCAFVAPLPGLFSPAPDPAGAALVENPLLVPVSDPEFVWNQLVDAIDSYFKVARQQRVRQIGGVLTEGRIDTFPQVGATVLEPWHRDSVSRYERWESTLQTIRRQATLRVTPAEGGYQLHLVVTKEMEAVDRPEHATVGGSSLRSEGPKLRERNRPRSGPVTLGWIPMGRDVALEQYLLREIRVRLHEPQVASRSLPAAGPPTVVPGP